MTKKNVYLIGNGSLGSFTAIILGRFAARFNWNLHFIDFDKVEERNLQNQFFRRQDLGKPKSLALADILSELQETSATSVVSEATAKDFFPGMVIVLVDSMKARKAIFEACRYQAATTHYLEARSGGDYALVYALDPRDPDCVRRYENTLYGDSEALPAPCATSRQIPMLFFVAGAVAELAARSEEPKMRPTRFIQITIMDINGLPTMDPESYTGFSY